MRGRSRMTIPTDRRKMRTISATWLPTSKTKVSRRITNRRPTISKATIVRTPRTRRCPAPERQEAAPLPDVGAFTLVMRDGTQVDALAFTRAQDKIIYITPDGGRRTVSASDIDSESTARVNEERGTPLQMPL